MRGVQLKDFPVAGLKNSVAHLRSKFGNDKTTDTGQIFGVTAGSTPTNTFHSSKSASPLRAKSQFTVGSSPVSSRNLKSTFCTETNNNIVKVKVDSSPLADVNSKSSSPSSSNRNSSLGSSGRDIIKKDDDSSSSNQVSIKTVVPLRSTRPQEQNIQLSNSRVPAPSPSVTISNRSVLTTPTNRNLHSSVTNAEKSSPTNLNRKSSSSNRTQAAVNGLDKDTPSQCARTTPINSLIKQVRTTPAPTNDRIIPTECQSDSPADVEVKTSTARDSNSSTFASSISIKMVDPALMDKYDGITDIEELNLKLKETRAFEERRAIRAAIRKLKDASNRQSNTVTNGNRSAAEDVNGREESSLDLSAYSTEEDLKILLHQTSKYEDKKRIRAAIREIRRNTESNTDGNKSIPKAVTVELSPSDKDGPREPSTPVPPSPDTVKVLRQLTNNSTGAGSGSSSCLPAAGLETTPEDDEVLVSPVKHKTRTLQRADGDIKIETFSKHSRTTSKSDVYEKSTRVTKISKVGELEIAEQDVVITKQKLSLKGSVTTEADLVRKVDIKEKDGSRLIEEDISIERSSHSQTTGQDVQSATQVSVVLEKYPPRVVEGLTDTQGVDGEPLRLTCQFDTPDGDNNKLEITWLKDGKAIKSDKDISMDWDGSVATLNIKELLYPDDSGSYVCRAKNKYGSVESSATVCVTELPQAPKLKLSTELCDLCVMDGDPNVTLRCKLLEKHEGVTINWYKNGKLLKDDAELKQKFDGLEASLIISEVFPEDSGEYECCLLKGSQELSSYAKVKVKAKDPPAESTSTETSSSLTVGGDVTKGSKENEDTNNNSCDKVEITPDDATTNGESKEVSKCEEVLKSATISEEKESAKPSNDTNSDTNASKQTTGSSPVEQVSSSNSSASSNGSNVAKPSLKPVLKTVPKSGGMSRPAAAANDTANCLVGKLSRPNTAGNVSVNQTWKTNIGGHTQQGQTSASRSWGKPGAMTALLGKGAPASARGAMAAFKQMDTANNPGAASAPKPKFSAGGKGGQPSVVEGLLRWCQLMTKEYENVKIDNFSTSWNNGVAFLALIHHFYPDSFDWAKVDERRRRENFQLAFDLAEQKADIAPLLEVDDMVRMKKPDWKCVFTYVQSFYRKLRDHENNKHTYMQQ